MPPKGHRLRRGRFSEPGRIYLVTFVTRSRIPIFRDLYLGRIVVNVMKGGTMRSGDIVLRHHARSRALADATGRYQIPFDSGSDGQIDQCPSNQADRKDNRECLAAWFSRSRRTQGRRHSHPGPLCRRQPGAGRPGGADWGLFVVGCGLVDVIGKQRSRRGRRSYSENPACRSGALAAIFNPNLQTQL